MIYDNLREKSPQQSKRLRADDSPDPGELPSSPQNLLSVNPYPAAAAAAMAFNPFLLHRPADYSMSSLLAQQPHYVPGLLPHHPGLTASILPKLQQTVAARSPFIGDILLPPQPMRSVRSLEPPDDQVQDDPKVELESKDLWEQFHNFGTEMVITKSGR